MSLHAQLSPEAQKRLHAQQKNSTITSIIISLLVVCLALVLLLFIFLPGIETFTPEIVSYQAGAEEKAKVSKPVMNRSVQRKPSAPSSSMAKVIAANTVSNTAVPIPEMDIPDPSTDLGNGDDFSDGWGSGDTNGGGGFASIPDTMRERCSLDDRLARLKANGGNKECEEAVVKALRWLKKTQNPDGSWTGKHQVGMTGLSVLAYLGHCETPNSEEFGDSVTRGIIYLINNAMKNDGKLTVLPLAAGDWVYEHAIATYALAEAYTFCSKLGISLPNLAEVTKKAGDMIIVGQGKNGGWTYGYSHVNTGDNSIGYWQIQALKACKHTGLWDEKDLKSVARKALAWLNKVQGKDGSIGYRDSPKKSPGLTGGGVLAFQMWGKSHSKNVRAGIKYILKNTSFDWEDPQVHLYYHYYHAQAMINRGGDDWKYYNNLFRDELIKSQNENGSWRKRVSHHNSLSLHADTCLSILMLEVYYRFLPATGQKGN